MLGKGNTDRQTSGIRKHVVDLEACRFSIMARVYLGVDATSCQAESNFSALKLIVSDLRAKSSPGKVEKTIFLRLNKHLIPGLGKVLGDLDALKDERKSSREAAAVNAKDAAAGLTNVSPTTSIS